MFAPLVQPLIALALIASHLAAIAVDCEPAGAPPIGLLSATHALAAVDGAGVAAMDTPRRSHAHHGGDAQGGSHAHHDGDAQGGSHAHHGGGAQGGSHADHGGHAHGERRPHAARHVSNPDPVGAQSTGAAGRHEPAHAQAHAQAHARGEGHRGHAHAASPARSARDADRHVAVARAVRAASEYALVKPVCPCGCDEKRARVGGGAIRLGVVVPGVFVARLPEMTRVDGPGPEPGPAPQFVTLLDPIPI